MAGWLENAAEKFLARYGDAITDNVRGMTAGAPTGRTEREIREAHDAWARTAELHRPYWVDGAEFEFLDDANYTRICSGEYTFVRRCSTGLVTRDGTYSFDVWFQRGRLTAIEPTSPSKPRAFDVTGDLRDDPEKWSTTYR